MNEKQIIGKTIIHTYQPNLLHSALRKDRNSMLDAFVDEAVRFYCLMLPFPDFPVLEAIKLAQRPQDYIVQSERLGKGKWAVTITEEEE